MPALLAGCGGGEPRMEAVSKVAVSQECIGCHSQATSPGTGLSIVAEWEGSRHALANAAGCADCHEPASGHPNECGTCHGGGTPTGYEVTLNPDQSGKCERCHAPGSTAHPLGTGKYHFDGRLIAGKNYSTARYVATQYRDRCRACHNPHDNTLLPQHRDWAQSLGDVTAASWTYYDFKTRGTSTPGATAANSTGANCVRCHTSTGFIRFVSSGFSDVRPFGAAGDKTREVVACDVCHDDGSGRAYNFARLRSVPAAVGYYNYSSLLAAKVLTSSQFPDVGASNLCIPCHTGRGTGALIKEIDRRGENFGNVSLINAHHLPSAGVLYQTVGFEFYTTAARYRIGYFKHDKIGVGNYTGTGSAGPCVGCHMSSDRSHTFAPFSRSQDGSLNLIQSGTCAICHTGGHAWTPQLLDAEKQQYLAALAALKQLLVQNNLLTGTTYTKNWNLAPLGSSVKGSAVVPGSGGIKARAYTMGAAANHYLLTEDAGSYAHNSSYTRRLIYDSIDWLLSTDGNLGNDVAGYLTGNGLTDAKAYLIKNGGRP